MSLPAKLLDVWSDSDIVPANATDILISETKLPDNGKRNGKSEVLFKWRNS